MSNVVFFGQADAGKSTLAGYIVSKYDHHFKLSRFIDSMKKANPDFNTIVTYSSIINTNKDEIERYRRLNSTSLHLRKVALPFDIVTVIDTPGSERFEKQRERGMYYGDIGVFFMEINNVLEHKYDIETLAPISLWTRLKQKRIIFALTKFDMVAYDKEIYNNAVKHVRELCALFGLGNDISIIPTAIEVDEIDKCEDVDGNEFGANICSTSDKMPWYNGKTLFGAIEQEIRELDERDEHEPILFCITDQIERPMDKAGKVWSIKLLGGIIHTGQQIVLAPVKDKNNNYGAITAEVKQIRKDISKYDEKETVAVARKGEMYGLDIKNCYYGKRKVGKSDFNAVSTTCGFAENVKYFMSKSFMFEVKREEIERFKIDKIMKLVWFGRSLPFVVKDKFGPSLIQGELVNTQIAVPLNGNDISQSIIVKGSDVMEFYNCRLVRVEDISR